MAALLTSSANSENGTRTDCGLCSVCIISSLISISGPHPPGPAPSASWMFRSSHWPTHSKHSKHHWPGLAHSLNIKKVLLVIFYPLMPWWDEFPSVSNFLPPPDTKLCEYRLELVIISIIFSLLFFIQEGLLPYFTKENHPVLDLRSADKVYFSNLHCSEV